LFLDTTAPQAGIPQGGSCFGILRWLKAALRGSYEQQSFHCQIRAFSCGCFGSQDALAAKRGKTILVTLAENFGKKLQLNRLTLIVVVDLPGT